MDKSIPHFRPKQLKVHTLSHHTYLYIAYFSKRVPPRTLKWVLKKMASASAVCISISTVLSILSLSMNNEAAALKLQKCKLPFCFEGHWRVSQNACKCLADLWSCISPEICFPCIYKPHKFSLSYSTEWGRLFSLLTAFLICQVILFPKFPRRLQTFLPAL